MPYFQFISVDETSLETNLMEYSGNKTIWKKLHVPVLRGWWVLLFKQIPMNVYCGVSIHNMLSNTDESLV